MTDELGLGSLMLEFWLVKLSYMLCLSKTAGTLHISRETSLSELVGAR